MVTGNLVQTNETKKEGNRIATLPWSAPFASSDQGLSTAFEIQVEENCDQHDGEHNCDVADVGMLMMLWC